MTKSSLFSFPLKIKIIALMLSLLFISLGGYAYYAINLFNEDKKAYIFENALNQLEQLHYRVNEDINSAKKHLEVLDSLEDQIELTDYVISEYLNENPRLLMVGKLNDSLESGQSFELYISEIYQNLLTTEKSKVQNRLHTYLRSKMRASAHDNAAVSLLNKDNKNLPANITVIYRSPSDQRYWVSKYEINSTLKSFEGQQLFNYKISDQKQNNIILMTEQSQLDSSIFDHSTNEFMSNIEGQQLVNIIEFPNQDRHLIALSRDESLGLTMVATISKTKAFAATNFLTRQSLFIALFIFSFSTIIGVLFAKSITKKLEELNTATEKLAEGNFDIDIKIKSRDEIGALGRAFNFMAGEILKYIDQMKEKQRLESEMRVAKLVQDTFIPEQYITEEKYSIASYYTPASECGGDWWGHYKISDDKSMIIIADATGHGVPAAFLTATIRSCVQTILDTTNSSLTSSEVLKIINQNIAKLSGSVLMTGFIGIIDTKEKKMEYSNASHMDPLILRVPKESIAQKDHFIPLLKAKGARLGHQSESLYENATIEILPNDIIILTTDGLLEVQNNDNKMWGQRNFLKSIINAYQDNNEQSEKAILDQVIKDIDAFRDTSKPRDDDETLVFIKINS